MPPSVPVFEDRHTVDVQLTVPTAHGGAAKHVCANRTCQSGIHRLCQEHLARCGAGDQTCGDIDGVSEYAELRALSRPDATDHDRTGRCADSDLQAESPCLAA